MKETSKQSRIRFFAAFALATALWYPAFTAEANEAAAVQSQAVMVLGETLDTDQAAPEPMPMQTYGVIKCCSGNVNGHPETCVWKPAGDDCQGDKAPAWCPSELSHPSYCRYI